MLIFLFLIIGFLSVLIYIITKPSIKSLLTKEGWCIDRIYYKNKLIVPETLNALRMVYTNGNAPCYENADFRMNGDLFLPCVKTRLISCTWKLTTADNLQIKADTLQIFQGGYDIDVSFNNLVLRSRTTTIYGHKDKTPSPKLF